MNLVEIPVGDWSGDGHSRCERFLIQTNKTAAEIADIHAKSAAVIGFDIGTIMSDCDDDTLYDYQIEALRTAGLDIWSKPYIMDNVDEWEKEECLVSMSPPMVFALWMDVLQLTDPSFTWSLVVGEQLVMVRNRPSIPGYGCFH